ncbi:MAG: 50S ribosomal protein L27 [Candidatus Paceibacterota bacterium]|jgi:large subunit ribosomal protein L27
MASTTSISIGRDSQPKFLGVKRYEGQIVKTGEVLVRQRGTKIIPGLNVKEGSDNTLYSMKDGKVYFTTKRKLGFNGAQKKVKVINVGDKPTKTQEVKKVARATRAAKVAKAAKK